MGATQSNLDQVEIAKLQNISGFSSSQLKRLFKRFQKLDKSVTGAITVEDFMSIPELAMNPLVDRMLKVFSQSIKGGATGSVNFEQFVKTLCVFLPVKVPHNPQISEKEAARMSQARRDAKLRFVFQLYDINNDGVIDENELLTVMKMMVTKAVREDQLKRIVKQTMEEANPDGGNKISFENFNKILKNTDLDQRMTIRF